MNAVILRDLVPTVNQNILVNVIVMPEMWVQFSTNYLFLIEMTNHQKWLQTKSSLVISDKTVTDKKWLIDQRILSHLEHFNTLMADYLTNWTEGGSLCV